MTSLKTIRGARVLRAIALAFLSAVAAIASAADLHAVGFRVVDGKAVQTWKVHDWISDCPVDPPAFFEPASIDVTDLDEKLFLIENGKKYPIRGATQWMRHDDDTDKDVYDSTMKIDIAFDAAPKVFNQFAVKKWRKFKAPNWEEGER